VDKVAILVGKMAMTDWGCHFELFADGEDNEGERSAGRGGRGDGGREN